MGVDVISYVDLLIRLGLAVYEAVKAGDTGRTVGQIFQGVGRDLDHVKALEAEAARHFEGRP